MKRFYTIVCLLMSIILTGYLFVHVSYMYRGYTRLMGFYGLQDNTVDVVLVGTSVTFSSFMPMEAWNEYGIASYNYCTNVQFENSLRHSVKEIVKTQSPKLILIDIAPFVMQHSAGNFSEDRNETNIRYNIDSMPYSFNRAQLIWEINSEVQGNMNSFFYYFFDISRYHTNVPSLSQYNNAYNDVARGYEHFGKNGAEVLNIAAFLHDDGAEKPLQGCHEIYLQDLLAEVDYIDCEVVYYCSPVIFVKDRDIDEYARKNYIKRIVEERGDVFWDLSAELGEIGLDYENDFWSCNHFDSLGAEKITEYLSERITELYDIPDRRDDVRYADWHEDYRSWIPLKEKYNGHDKREVD